MPDDPGEPERLCGRKLRIQPRLLLLTSDAYCRPRVLGHGVDVAMECEPDRGFLSEWDEVH